MTDLENRPYHHGDLRRGLVEAARRVLETEGPAALSLRAVAREAGVSPAAPYHHFKDKAELLDAVAHQGWEMLDEGMQRAQAEAGDHGGMGLTPLLLAYVRFAREHPALYRVMYDAARDQESLPIKMQESEGGPYARVRECLRLRGAAPEQHELELATIAAWCVAHGMSELDGFKQFAALKDEMGGEDAFVSGVMRQLSRFLAHD